MMRWPWTTFFSITKPDAGDRSVTVRCGPCVSMRAISSGAIAHAARRARAADRRDDARSRARLSLSAICDSRRFASSSSSWAAATIGEYTAIRGSPAVTA